MEKRIGKRVDFNKRCEIIDSTNGDIITTPALLNISTGGVCLASDESFEPGTTFVLKIPLTLTRVLKLPVQVVDKHVKHNFQLYCIKFTAINMLEKSYIRNYISTLKDMYRKQYNI